MIKIIATTNGSNKKHFLQNYGTVLLGRKRGIIRRTISSLGRDENIPRQRDHGLFHERSRELVQHRYPGRQTLLHHEWIVQDKDKDKDKDKKNSSNNNSNNNNHHNTQSVLDSTHRTGGPVDSNRVVVFLHGLMGNGKNLRTPAKRLVEETGVSALLLDLRGHGQSSSVLTQSSSSSSSGDFVADDESHTIEDCAKDVIYTLEQLQLTGDKSPIGIVGHSFGGRCALAYHHYLSLMLLQLRHMEEDASSRRRRLSRNDSDCDTDSDSCNDHDEILKRNHAIQQEEKGNSLAAQVLPPRHCWILDSCPGKVPSSVMKVIEVISSISMPLGSKKELVEMLTREKNIDAAIASWMATNLKPIAPVVRSSDDNHNSMQRNKKKMMYDFVFDLNVIMGILKDFPRQDMMKMLQECLKGGEAGTCGGTINMVIASKNDAWTEGDILDRLETMKQEEGNRLRLNLLHLNAGHWVHVDALDELMVAMVQDFRHDS